MWAFLCQNQYVPLNQCLCGGFLVQITLLAENGGENVTEFCKRNMKFLFSPQLARQYNLSGQRDKDAFKPLELFNVMFGGYFLSVNLLHCFAYNDRGMYLSCTACGLQALALNDIYQPLSFTASLYLGPFHGAIAVPSVTRCRCCRCCCRGHRTPPAL